MRHKAVTLCLLGAMAASVAIRMPALAGEAEKSGDARRQAWITSILARPLFHPERRGEGRSLPNDDVPVLTGIVDNGLIRTALFFQAASPDHNVALAEGGVVNDWRVMAVESDAVLLARGFRRVRLTPDFVHGGKPVAPVPVTDGSSYHIPIVKTKRTDPHLAW